MALQVTWAIRGFDRGLMSVWGFGGFEIFLALDVSVRSVTSRWLFSGCLLTSSCFRF